MADFTYVWTAEGWLYVAVVIDLFSRRVVSWFMSSMIAQLLAHALIMAIWRRGKPLALQTVSQKPLSRRAMPHRLRQKRAARLSVVASIRIVATSMRSATTIPMGRRRTR